MQARSLELLFILLGIQSRGFIPIYNAKPKLAERALKHVYQELMNKTRGKELDLWLLYCLTIFIVLVID